MFLTLTKLKTLLNGVGFISEKSWRPAGDATELPAWEQALGVAEVNANKTKTTVRKQLFPHLSCEGC